jgi:hypothetical protein
MEDMDYIHKLRRWFMSESDRASFRDHKLQRQRLRQYNKKRVAQLHKATVCEVFAMLKISNKLGLGYMNPLHECAFALAHTLHTSPSYSDLLTNISKVTR